MSGLDVVSQIFPLVPRRAATRTALAIAVLAVAGFAIGGPAHAQDCAGGYRMIKGEIPVICQEATGPRALFSPGDSSQPFHTGSINRSEQPASAARPANSPVTEPSTAASSNNGAAACDHGMRFVETPNNGATLMIKCS